MKAIIFDLDGTLIDSAPDIHAAVNKSLAETGDGELPLETVRGFIGNGVAVLIDRVIEAQGLPADRHGELLDKFLRHYEADPVTLTTLFPGVHDAVEQFKDEGWAMGVCTNKPASVSRQILDDLGVGQHISVIVGGDSTDAKKPDPKPLLACKEQLGADGVVYVGDSEIDAECAKRAGIRFALFTEGYRKGDIDDMPQDARFSDFDVLVAIVARLADELR